MIRLLRVLLILLSLSQLVFAIGFVFQIRLFTRLWPLPYTNALSFIFIGSIAFAAVASTAWCLLTGELAGVAGIALDYIMIFVPISILMFQLGGSGSTLRAFGVLCAATAIFGVILLVWSLRFPARDLRPVPRPVRLAFGIFVIALLVAGGQMALKNTRIMPWSISTEATIIYGWMFLGAAAYFAYGIVRPGWFNAGGQLAGFLAYDLVLIVPFIQRLPVIEPELRINLIIYLIVLIASAALALYYLFIHPDTRLRRQAQPAA